MSQIDAGRLALNFSTTRPREKRAQGLWIAVDPKVLEALRRAAGVPRQVLLLHTPVLSWQRWSGDYDLILVKRGAQLSALLDVFLKTRNKTLERQTRP